MLIKKIYTIYLIKCSVRYSYLLISLLCINARTIHIYSYIASICSLVGCRPRHCIAIYIVRLSFYVLLAKLSPWGSITVHFASNLYLAFMNNIWFLFSGECQVTYSYPWLLEFSAINLNTGPCWYLTLWKTQNHHTIFHNRLFGHVV